MNDKKIKISAVISFILLCIVAVLVMNCSTSPQDEPNQCDCVYVTVISNETSYTLYEGTFFNYLNSDPFTGELIMMYENCDRTQVLRTEIITVQ